MTYDEVNKYNNEVAFSGAEEFLDQYKDSAKDSGIIGHFGLGFTRLLWLPESWDHHKSFKDEPAAHWTCDGSPEFTLKSMTKKKEVQKSFCTSTKIQKIFGRHADSFFTHKYNKFMPIPIKMGTKEITKTEGAMMMPKK